MHDPPSVFPAKSIRPSVFCVESCPRSPVNEISTADRRDITLCRKKDSGCPQNYPSLTCLIIGQTYVGPVLFHVRHARVGNPCFVVDDLAGSANGVLAGAVALSGSSIVDVNVMHVYCISTMIFMEVIFRYIYRKKKNKKGFDPTSDASQEHDVCQDLNHCCHFTGGSQMT